ncbi:hypothetical protein AMTRI_Chr12g270560 [Amborella trichopoda]
MEIPHGQRFVQTQRGSTGKLFRSNQFFGSEKYIAYVRHGMSNFFVRISTVMSLLDSPIEIRENPIQFSMEMEFCKLSPELEDHFEIFEHIRGLYHRGTAFSKKLRGIISKKSEKRNIRDHKHRLFVAKYELRRKLYKAFCKDPDLLSDIWDKHRYKLSKLLRNNSFARVRNRCISTSRPRSIYEFFRISYIIFCGLASRVPLMGIKKSSW